MAKKEKGTPAGSAAGTAEFSKKLHKELRKAFSAKVRVRPKNQITVPSGVAKTLRVHEGDELEFAVNDRGEMVVRGLTAVPTDQAWFFTQEWLEGEQEASEQIEAGRTDFYEDVDALFAGLDADDDEDGER